MNNIELTQNCFKMPMKNIGLTVFPMWLTKCAVSEYAVTLAPYNIHHERHEVKVLRINRNSIERGLEGKFKFICF
jgi:hypothetical protein